MKIALRSQDVPALTLVVAWIAVSGLAGFFLFSDTIGESGRKAERAGAELVRCRALLENRDAIRRVYGELLTRSGAAGGGWVDALTAAADAEGVAFDSLVPGEDRGGPDLELTADLNFRSDLPAAGGFLARLAADPLCRIEELSIRKTREGVLDVRVLARRAVP